jgi:hypothetical protein
MKICDLTQFYSPVSGGVKRYLHEKIDYIDRHASRYEHVLIVPGAKTKLKGKRALACLHDSFSSCVADRRNTARC